MSANASQSASNLQKKKKKSRSTGPKSKGHHASTTAAAAAAAAAPTTPSPSNTAMTDQMFTMPQQDSHGDELYHKQTYRLSQIILFVVFLAIGGGLAGGLYFYFSKNPKTNTSDEGTTSGDKTNTDGSNTNTNTNTNGVTNNTDGANTNTNLNTTTNGNGDNSTKTTTGNPKTEASSFWTKFYNFLKNTLLPHIWEPEYIAAATAAFLGSAFVLRVIFQKIASLTTRTARFAIENALLVIALVALAVCIWAAYTRRSTAAAWGAYILLFCIAGLCLGLFVHAFFYFMFTRKFKIKGDSSKSILLHQSAIDALEAGMDPNATEEEIRKAFVINESITHMDKFYITHIWPKFTSFRKDVSNKNFHNKWFVNTFHSMSKYLLGESFTRYRMRRKIQRDHNRYKGRLGPVTSL